MVHLKPADDSHNFSLGFRTFYDEELEASDHFYGNQQQLLQLCYALYNILAAR